MTDLALQQEVKLVQEIATGNTTVSAATAKAQGMETGVFDLDRKLANAYKKIGNDYEAILVADAQGKVYADSAGGKNNGMNLAERAYFKKAKQGQANVSTAVKSKLSGNPIAPVAAPVYSETGQFAGGRGGRAENRFSH